MDTNYIYVLEDRFTENTIHFCFSKLIPTFCIYRPGVQIK